MQQANNAAFTAQSVSDTHHDVLSVNNKPNNAEQDLLSFLQAAPVDPLSLLTTESTSEFLLNNVVLEPQEAVIEAPKSVRLGSECRLSRSALWTIQENYYRAMGIQAWASNVPFFVTSSTYTAECYADMIIAFINDYYEHLNLDEPLYIIEMATGSGRFSHLTVKELESKLAWFEKMHNIRVKYVMTDFSDSNPSFWESHPKFKPYLNKGILDFGVFNPLQDQSITLRHSGEVISAESVKNPIIAIANYFFDTIPQDVFRVENKRLHEGLVTLERNLENVEDPASDPRINEVTDSYRYQELRSDNYYGEARLNNVLRFYKHNIKDGTFIFPVGAFDVLGNLRAMSSNRLVLLSSDKAYTDYKLMGSYQYHGYALHGGAFSYMVNYDAIGRYFEGGGGLWMYTDNNNLSLQTVCCIETDHPECRFEQLKYVFHEKLNRVNAINTVCALLPEDRENSDVVQIDYWIAYIRLNLADPKIFNLVTYKLLPHLSNILPVQKEELLKMMAIAHENFYYFQGEVNLPFCFCQLYYALGMFPETLASLDETMAMFGEHEALFFMKGQAHEGLNQLQQAKQMYEKALAINPNFGEIYSCLDILNERLK